MREKCVLAKGRHVHDGFFCMRFVKSGFVIRGFCSIFDDEDRSGKRTKISETGDCVLQKHRVYATLELGGDSQLINILC